MLANGSDRRRACVRKQPATGRQSGQPGRNKKPGGKTFRRRFLAHGLERSRHGTADTKAFGRIGDGREKVTAKRAAVVMQWLFWAMRTVAISSASRCHSVVGISHGQRRAGFNKLEKQPQDRDKAGQASEGFHQQQASSPIADCQASAGNSIPMAQTRSLKTGESFPA